MSNSFEIGTQEFKLNKINAFKQFHIVKRISPILADMIPAMKDMQKVGQGKQSESDKLDEFAKILTPIMNGIAKLSDADSDKVLYGLLSSVEVKQGVGWAKVSTDEMLMMQDMELPLLLQLAGRAFAFNLQGFFAAVPKK